MTTPALNQHLAAPLRQIPGQTVRVADGDHRQFGFLLCLKDPPVPGALSGLHSADTGHSGPERQNRPQVKASLNRRIIASNSIECDSSPDIVTGLSWEVPKSIAGLDMNFAGIISGSSEPGHRIIEQGQLLLGVGNIFGFQAVRDV